MSESPRATADPAAVARRQAARQEKVAAGIDELDRWLSDQVRSGLAGLPRAGYRHVDAMAARMVDAQAPGVAGMLRGMPSDLVGEEWPSRALHQLGRLHLLVQAHRGLDDLPEDLQATVRSRVGYPTPKAQVLATAGVTDRWFALGAVDTVEFQLESRRVWLVGAETKRWGVWLAFAPPGQELDTSVLPGQGFVGDLHFYPGSGQFRALVGERREEPAGSLSVDPGTLTEVRAAFAALLAADPWATRMPALIRGTPVVPAAGEGWRIRDETGACCPAEAPEEGLWPLLASSCGEPVTVFGEWHGSSLLPLSVVVEPAGAEFTTAVVG